MLRFNDTVSAEELRDAARAVSLAISILRRAALTTDMSKVFHTLEDAYLLLLQESFRQPAEKEAQSEIDSGSSHAATG